MAAAVRLLPLLTLATHALLLVGTLLLLGAGTDGSALAALRGGARGRAHASVKYGRRGKHPLSAKEKLKAKMDAKHAKKLLHASHIEMKHKQAAKKKLMRHMPKTPAPPTPPPTIPSPEERLRLFEQEYRMAHRGERIRARKKVEHERQKEEKKERYEQKHVMQVRKKLAHQDRAVARHEHAVMRKDLKLARHARTPTERRLLLAVEKEESDALRRHEYAVDMARVERVLDKVHRDVAGRNYKQEEVDLQQYRQEKTLIERREVPQYSKSGHDLLSSLEGNFVKRNVHRRRRRRRRRR